jgi:hypothetical protein
MIIWQSTVFCVPIDAERLNNGNTLICDYWYGRVIEVDNMNTIVWEMTGLETENVIDAERLDNGNTLITWSWSNRVTEVDGYGTIVWEKTGLADPFDAERLDNGNTLIVERDNSRAIEVDSSGTIVWQMTGLGDVVDIEIVHPVPYYVEIDIKPGSYPNSINLGNEGVIPVAILSSWDFDATTVDPATVELAGAGVELRGKSDKAMAHKEDSDGDGLIDLVVQITTQNLDPGTFQDGYATLTGSTYDGTAIEGSDEINIVPK